MLATLLLATLVSAAGADPEPAEKDAGQEARRRDEVAVLAPAKARQVRLVVGQEQTQEAVLRAEPLLRWSNPTAGSVYGEVYLWSVRGRPAAIASIFRGYHPFKDCVLEAVSVSPSRVRAYENKELLWDAKASGVAFKPLSGAPAPAEAAGARLGQMRSLARRFSAELADQRGGEQIARQLRLLSQPVHRYASPEERVVDGALFGMVEVTDPEVWILLEAVKEPDADRVTWQYALARMNADPIDVSLDGKRVQHWDKVFQPWKYREAPYATAGFTPESVKIEKE